jgi:GGDEF domain-containing protein
LKLFVASTPSGLRAATAFEEPLDPVTGLPTRAFAENLIDERLTCGTECLAGVVTVNRFDSLHSSFGQEVMDDMITTVAHLLAQRLPEATTLCRWSASSFIAITDIVSSYAETAQQWRRVRGLKAEKQIDNESKTALVLLNTSLMVEHMRPVSSKRAFVQDVERFVMEHSKARS